MATQAIKLEGLKELDEALKEFPRATSRAVLRRTLLKATAPMEARARQLAPRRTGRLAASIEIGTRLSKRQKRLHQKQSAVEVFAGARALPHAHLQEFGTRHHPPRPFMRPAWDETKRGIALSIRDQLAEEIEKTRARIARKAERLAAKMKAT